jgi:hypothetical protein
MTSVTKAGFPRNDFKRMTATLNHVSCRFEAKLFNGFGRRLARFRKKDSPELPRTEMRGPRQIIDAKRTR